MLLKCSKYPAELMSPSRGGVVPCLPYDLTEDKIRASASESCSNHGSL